MAFPSSVSGRTRSKLARFFRDLKFRSAPSSLKKDEHMDPGSLGKARGTEKNPFSLECDSDESERGEGSSDEVNGLTDNDDKVIICGETEGCEEDEELERWNKKRKQLQGEKWWEADSDDDEEEQNKKQQTHNKSGIKMTKKRGWPTKGSPRSVIRIRKEEEAAAEETRTEQVKGARESSQ